MNGKDTFPTINDSRLLRIAKKLSKPFSSLFLATGGSVSIYFLIHWIIGVQKLFKLDSNFTTLGTADEKGTGLGLVLCKQFIEKQNDRIWVESALSKGTRFYFTLPLSKTT